MSDFLQDGASDEEINALSKFTFRRTGSFDNGVGEKPSPSKGIMIAVGSPEETKGRLLTAENAVGPLTLVILSLCPSKYNLILIFISLMCLSPKGLLNPAQVFFLAV